jgi:glycosyltransferase involved in cell wall biosynthesis
VDGGLDQAKYPGVTSTLNLSVLCYPYHPSKHTGRGHDRYVAELVDNVVEQRKDVQLRVVDHGFSKNVLEGGLKLPRQLADMLRANADVYHAISPVGGATAALLGKGPLVVTIHDVIPFNMSGELDSPLKYRIWRQCIRLCLKRAAAIVVPYHITKDYLVQQLGADANKIHVVNYGVDHSVYFPRPAIERVKRRVLYVGEVSRSKGVETLIRAFAKVRKQLPDAELLIGGKRARDQPMLEELARSLGIEELSFLGFIAENELADHYAKTTVMVFPSHCGFGLSTLEAMACGTPVVGVSALDAPEFFADAGILAEPDNVDDLASCLSRVLASPTLQAELSAKSLARAGLFSWAKTARETADIYSKIVRN